MLKYQISRKSVQWELSCSMRTDGRTDRHDGPNRRLAPVCVPVCVCTSLPHLILHIDMYKRYVIGGHCKLETRSFVRS